MTVEVRVAPEARSFSVQPSWPLKRVRSRCMQGPARTRWNEPRAPPRLPPALRVSLLLQPLVSLFPFPFFFFSCLHFLALNSVWCFYPRD